MDTKAAIIALLSVWGVGTCAVAPTMAQDTEDAASDDDTDRSNPLLNKVWVRSDAEATLPIRTHLARYA